MTQKFEIDTTDAYREIGTELEGAVSLQFSEGNDEFTFTVEGSINGVNWVGLPVISSDGGTYDAGVEIDPDDNTIYRVDTQGMYSLIRVNNPGEYEKVVHYITGGVFAGPFSMWPMEYPVQTEAGVRAALSKLIARGGGYLGIDSPITITAPLIDDVDVSRITLYGIKPPGKTYNGDVPDEDWVYDGTGALLTGNTSFNCIQVNHTAKGSPDSDFAGNSLYQFKVENIGFKDFKSAIVIGATNDIGAVECQFNNLSFYGCLNEPIILTNPAHCEGRGLFCVNNGAGPRFVADVLAAVLQPGNSEFTHIFDWSSNDRNRRGIVIEATAGSIMNSFRLFTPQSNAFSRTLVSETATFTNASPNIQVPTIGSYPLNGVIIFNADVAGFTGQQAYFIVAKGANYINIANTPDGAAINATASTTGSIRFYGRPNLEIIGWGTGRVNNTRILDFDCEGSSSASVLLYNAGVTKVDFGQVTSTGNVHFHVVRRQANYAGIYSEDTLSVDGDSGSSYGNGNFHRGLVTGQQLQGFGRDTTNNLPAIWAGPSTGNTPDFLRYEPGGYFWYPNRSMGKRNSPHNNGWGTPISINANYCEMLNVDMTSGDWVANLPTGASNYLGCPWWFINTGSKIGTINRGGTDLFNNLTGWTAITLSPGCHVMTNIARKADGTYYLQTFPGRFVNEEITISSWSLNSHTCSTLETLARIIRLTSTSASSTLNFPTTTPRGRRLIINDASHSVTIKVTGQTGFSLASGKRCEVTVNSAGTDMEQSSAVYP